ncbi:WhiB family transcriptional regulator [Streptomyces rectiviolaceus]|uniref:4Fe-4S Wbl-type domain-containing protein n=1 Tax=Streptomyces rectiviolaceus TaxID=332591 RepID=A0ABP6NQ86_9ACTN
MSAAWEENASCRNLELSLFYPAKEAVEQAEQARTVCATCPVREQCLTSTLADEKRLTPSDRDGIRAGLDGRERYILQHGQPKPRQRKPRTPRPAKPRTLAPCGTPAAYDRHMRRGEPIDDACRVARRVRYRPDRRTLATDPVRPDCGTRSGYQWHTAHHEVPCQPCTDADLAAAWFIRQLAATTG